MSADPLRIFVGETSNYIDACDYVKIKEIQGWKVLVPPYAHVVIEIKNGAGSYQHQSSWTFVLHRLHLVDLP